MALPAQFFGRCASCLRNFKQLWCQTTCSPYQNSFMDVTETKMSPRTNKTYVSAIRVFVTRDFLGGMFNSCRNVIYPASNSPAIDMMCGSTGDQCTVDTMAKYLGDNPYAPIKIDIKIDNNPSGNYEHTPLNASVVPCDQMTPELDLACSCQDCKDSCPPVVPYPDVSEGKCMFFGMECMVFMSLLAFVGLCFVIILMSALHYVISKSSNEPATPVDAKSVAAQDDYCKTETGEHLINDSEVTLCENIGAWLESRMEWACCRWGRLCTRHPMLVFLAGLMVSGLFSLGILRLKITTDPVALWSSSTSQGRQERNYFDQNFGPFYRTAQIIIVPKNHTPFIPDAPLAFYSDYEAMMREDSSSAGDGQLYSPIYQKDFLFEILQMQLKLENLTGEYGNRTIRLTDICEKPMAPESDNCLVMSPLGWFQNSADSLNKVGDSSDYLTHIVKCMESPTETNDKNLKLSCLAPYGGPVFPYVVIGNYEKGQYAQSAAIIVTYLIRNNVDVSKNGPAEAWEASFIDFLKNYKSDRFTLSFMAERSVEDEISRESKSDVMTILISYAVMFAYIAFSLGQYNIYNNNLAYFLVQSKIVLGLIGVLIVMLSVTSSIGLFALAGVPATLIIVEVVPFLVLAVGVDNIFIMVQHYQRDKPSKNESLEMRMGRLGGETIPTMLLSSLSECFCFMLGALSTMPAVRTFSLYAGMAILFDFILQVTCFAPLFTLDVKRQEAYRLELAYCVRLAPPARSRTMRDEGMLYAVVRDYYTPFLLHRYVKVGVLILFISWLCVSLSVLGNIEVGLDQALAMPEDSYVLRYFRSMAQYLSVGPPVYFIIKGNYSYNNVGKQNLICGGGGCQYDSLLGQVYTASIWSNKSYIAQPATSWLDDYVDWLRPVGNPPCCRTYNDDKFCPSTVKNDSCFSCRVNYTGGRPDPNQFYRRLPMFLHDNPGPTCTKGGHAAYNRAVKFNPDGTTVAGSYFMTYHTVLKTSQDYTNALRNARRISENVTRTLNEKGVQVFAYSVFYVFYEQYLTVVHDAVVQLFVSLVAIFFVTTFLLGLDPWSGAIIVSTIVLILVNMIGMMYFWSVSFNAISLVNLVMCVGISVEFCAHLVRAFKVNTGLTRNERAKESLATMGSSVLSGITLTKFGGIVVLAFSHSQIFQIFYFRMYMAIVLIGATHGLIFLPVFLSFVGPPLNKRKFLLKQHNTGGARSGVDNMSGGAFRQSVVIEAPPADDVTGRLTDSDTTTTTTTTMPTPTQCFNQRL